MNILRRQMERAGPGAPEPEGARWLRRLARWPWTYPLIAVVAAGLVVAAALM